jgi:murein L,D-transpeptidase YcbB/YkuD
MIPVRRCAVFRVSVVTLLLIALGCHSQITPPPAQEASSPNSEVIAGQLRTIAGAGTLADLTWPNFSDYQQQVQGVYEAVNYTPVWVRDGQATTQAQAVITALENSRQKGLTPGGYDATRWSSRLSALKSAPADANRVAHFDAALTVCAMRYISDLHIGRVNPKYFKVGIDVAPKSYDLPQFLRQKLLGASNVPEVLNDAQPPYYAYRRTEAALQAMTAR